MHIIIFLILGLFWTVPLLSQTADIGAVYYKSGNAEIIRNGKRTTATPGTKLQEQDIVETGSKATLGIELRGGIRLKLKEKSQLGLSRITNEYNTTLNLNRGAVFSKIAARKETQFSIKTPVAVAAVRGTEFFFSYGKKDDELWLCVNEGKVAVLGIGETREKIVPEGQGVFIGKKGKVTDPEVLTWTKQLNWNMDSGQGKLEDTTDIRSAYKDLLKYNYD